MAEEFVASFKLEKEEGQTVQFSLQESAINATFSISQGGTDDHTKLRNREMNDQHPMEAITGLTESLANLVIQSGTFIYEQAESNMTWDIHHNLNKKPSITVVDEFDRVIEGDREYVDDNHVIISFNAAFKGKAYLN